MKYTKEQRLEIGRQIYEGEISHFDAAEQYGITTHSTREYMRLYRHKNHLPPKCGHPSTRQTSIQKTVSEQNNLEAYEAMSKEELIQELVKARIAEARLKKGYEVKGDGSVIRYSNKNIK